MPELPEVETVKRGLGLLIVGKKISNVTSDNYKSFPNAEQEVSNFLFGSRVLSIDRRAKVLMIHLSTKYSLVIHLKMTGQIVFRGEQVFGAGHPNDSLIGDLPDKSTRVIIDFTDGSKLFFNDQRKFGWMKLLPTIEIPNIDFMKKVGPEPLKKDFLFQDFKARFERKKRSNIKAALLDQSVIAGIGNIYADESLWYAGVHPQRIVASITDAELQKIYQGIRSIMTTAIQKGGSTDKNYVNAEGKKGSYLDFAEVFRREGQKCSRCGSEIIKIRVAGRGTHICPSCQKL